MTYLLNIRKLLEEIFDDFIVFKNKMAHVIELPGVVSTPSIISIAKRTVDESITIMVYALALVDHIIANVLQCQQKKCFSKSGKKMKAVKDDTYIYIYISIHIS